MKLTPGAEPIVDTHPVRVELPSGDGGNAVISNNGLYTLPPHIDLSTGEVLEGEVED